MPTISFGRMDIERSDETISDSENFEIASSGKKNFSLYIPIIYSNFNNDNPNNQTNKSYMECQKMKGPMLESNEMKPRESIASSSRSSVPPSKPEPQRNDDDLLPNSLVKPAGFVGIYAKYSVFKY